MQINELRDYRNWIGLSAEQIHRQVLFHKGWNKVFPKSNEGLPIWLSRVRNYFNYYPKMLKCLGKQEGALQARIGNIYHGGYLVNGTDTWFASKALSSVVYQDELNQYWYQMSPGGTGYHFKNTNLGDSNSKIKGVRSTIVGQDEIPILKLISPDFNGGSREIILRSKGKMTEVPRKSKFIFGLSGFVLDHAFPKSAMRYEKKRGDFGGGFLDIQIKEVVKGSYEGSYNYAETTREGFKAHEYYDIKPHKTTPGFYINPSYSALKEPLSKRTFKYIVESSVEYEEACKRK